jgi:hypothetical protein
VYAIAIAFELLGDGVTTRQAGDRLAELVHENDFRIATGFIGTPLVCDALTSTGHLEIAYRLLIQTECPSWLYPVTQGATTTTAAGVVVGNGWRARPRLCRAHDQTGGLPVQVTRLVFAKVRIPASYLTGQGFAMSPLLKLL